jgi:hypothetical protein
VFNSPPAVVAWGSNRLDIFGLGTDDQMYHKAWDGTQWLPSLTDWDALGGVFNPSPLPSPQNIGLRMQYQESNEWCWIAVAASINYFYNPASTATQCGIMTTIGQTINHFPSNTSACPSAQVIASTPGLAAILANPYDKAAEFVLDNAALGIDRQYLKSGGIGDALDVNGNNAGYQGAGVGLAAIAQEVNSGRPVCVDITWKNGAQHVVAIAGVLDDNLLILDPANGESVFRFGDFPSAYFGGATVNSYCFTKSGS